MTPSSFRRDLKQFDSKLDFEWNAPKMQWEVVGYDLKHQRYVIKEIPLGQIDQVGTWVLQDLYEMSPTKQGGAKEMNRKMDAALENRERQQEKDRANMLEGLHDEAYMHIQHGIGQRISMHVPEKSEAGIVITDKRRVAMPA